MRLGRLGAYLASLSQNRRGNEMDANDELRTQRAAEHRVRTDPELLEHYDGLIAYDWPNYAEHMEWVATAPKAALLEWAEEIAPEKPDDE